MYNKLNLDTIKTFQRSWYHIIKHDYHDFVGSLGWMYWWLGFYFRCLGMHFMFCRNIRQRFRFSSSIKPIAHLQGVSFNYRLWFKLAWVCTTECALIHSFGANPKHSFVCAGASTCSMCSAGSYADATGLMLWYRNIENRLSSSIWWVSNTIYCLCHDVRYQFKLLRSSKQSRCQDNLASEPNAVIDNKTLYQINSNNDNNVSKKIAASCCSWWKFNLTFSNRSDNLHPMSFWVIQQFWRYLRPEYSTYALNPVTLSLFTQPAPHGRPSRFSSQHKGAGVPHPIRAGGVWSTVLDGVGTSDRA